MQTSEKVKQFLKEWGKGPRCLLLYGPPGVGKTYSVHQAARELGYHVAEFNASEKRDKEFIERLKTLAETRSLEDTVILLDEADGMEKRDISPIIARTTKPIVLTANNVNKIPQSVRDFCVEIFVPPPDYGELMKVGKVRQGMPRDYRQAMIEGSEGYKPEEYWLDRLRKWQLTGEIDERWDDRIAISLLENLPRMAFGWKLYVSYLLLAQCDKWKNFRPLNGFKVDIKARPKNVVWWEMRKNERD